MESVQLRPIDHSRLIAYEHAPAVVETVDHDRSRIAEPYLEDGVLVFVPPFLPQHISSMRL